MLFESKMTHKLNPRVRNLNSSEMCALLGYVPHLGFSALVVFYASARA